MALYNKAGEILDKLEAQKGTIRSLCLADDVADKKRTYALVCESLKYKEVLQLIIKQAGLLEAEKSKKLKKGVANVLVYDLLFGRGIQTGGGYKEIITKHRTRLQAELAKIKIKRKVRDNKDLIPAHIRDAVVLPRWVRVNTLVSSVKKVLDRFEKLGYRIDTETPPPELKGLVLQQDKHIPELLALPSSTDLHDNPLLLDGSIIIQDKASCFPAYVLNPPQGAVCIDACAAPGNKTSHLSAIMRNTGKIYAFDMDKRRLGILQRLTKRAGCKNIDPTLGNFLETSGSDPRFKNVEYILLDPSCSGSGIVGRMDHLLEGIPAEENDSENPSTTPSTTESRITSLATFQLSALLHALTFPSLKKVVYSTCSKHREENEEVVRAVLEQQSDFVLAKGVFEGWETRGWTQEDPLGEGLGMWGRECVRTDPRTDFCIGFFVAVFERRVGSEGAEGKTKTNGKGTTSGHGPPPPPPSSTSSSAAKRPREEEDVDGGSDHEQEDDGDAAVTPTAAHTAAKKKKSKKKKPKKKKAKIE